MKNLKNRFFRQGSIKWLLFLALLYSGNYLTAQHFQTVWSNNPYQPMNILVDSAWLDSANLKANDEIAVFDVDGSGNELCVGVIVLIGEFLPDTNYTIIAATDDPTTPDMDGFIQGHNIIYRYWDDSEADEFVLFQTTYNSALDSTYSSLGTALVFLNGFSALTWTGNANNSWNDSANWNLNRLPDTSIHARIPTGLTNYPTLSAAGKCKNLILLSDTAGDASILGDDSLWVDGKAIIERYVTGGKWHDISAPLTGQKAKKLYLNNNPKVWLKSYDEPTNTRNNITQLSTPMHPGAGFEVWVETGNNATFTFDGPMQTTDLTLNTSSVPPLSYSGPEPYGYNLIGNPFASPLDWDTGSWNLVGVNGSIWVWDPSAGNYKVRSGGIGSLTDGIIPLAQAFFIQATSAAASITLPMDARVHSAQSYYKQGSDENAAVQYFSIKALNGTWNDEAFVVFTEDASPGFDSARDARKLFALDGKAPQIYIRQSEELLSINAIPPITQQGQTVELFFVTGISGEQTLKANTSALTDTKVELEDLFSGNIQNLMENPVYNFLSDIGSNPQRFLLHFSPSATGTDEHQSMKNFQVYSWDKWIYIRSNGGTDIETKEVFVYELSGRQILQATLAPAELSKIPLHTSSSIVVVKVIGKNSSQTAKVFIH